MSKYPKSTIIISVYKDIKSLASQTILPDEVLISMGYTKNYES